MSTEEPAPAPVGLPARYRILQRLGSGGMGDVYAAVDETLQRRVALKSIQARRRLNTESQERFLREARILSQLDHPHICRAFDYIRGEDSDWLVMELVEGWTLGDVLAKKPMGSDAAKVAEQVAGVLVVTHAAGIVHRDLKPGNVMITPSGDAKVLDFGIARTGDGGALAALAERSATLASDADTAINLDITRTSDQLPASDAETLFHTRLNSTLGTLAYMSPEQARGETATPASDMFSFGLLLQEMITGKRAFDTNDRATLVERVRTGQTVPIGDSSDLVKLVRALTAVAPSQRPTAVDAVERLRWIRETPKRRIRRLAIAAAVLVVALASLKYTFDLRRERTAALAAEQDANRRRGQAEGLIGFMLDDLRSKLTQVGRLDLLESVHGQAMTYFGSVPASSLTNEELSRRAQTPYQIGSVRQHQGNLKLARAAYDESLANASLVAARDPGNADFQVRLGTAHFYAGDVRRRENDLAGAMREFKAYQDIGDALARRDAGNLVWALEKSYGHSNVAAVQELQGDLDGARQNLELALAVKSDVAAREPRDVAHQKDVANANNRLGQVLDKLGNGDAALAHYNADLDIRKNLVALKPTDQSIKRPLFTALCYVAQAHDERGDVLVAMANYQAAYALMSPLAASDLKNADWQRDLATADRFVAELESATGRTAEARVHFQRAVAVLAPIAAAAPTDVTRQRDLVQAELGLGVVELKSGNVAAARASGTSAERALAALAAKKIDAETTRLLVEEQLLMGDILQRSGDVKGAGQQREAALAATRGIAGTHSKRLRATEARVLIALGRADEARPIVMQLVAIGYRQPLLAAAWKRTGGVLDSALLSKSR